MTIAEAIAPPAPPPEATQPDITEITGGPPAGVKRRRRWVFPVAITAAAVAVYAVVFLVLIERSGPEDEPPDAASTTVADTEPATTVATSAPDTSTTTQSPATSTTAGATTTTTTTEPPPTTTTLPPIPAVGEPIALEDLTLGAFSLGPLSMPGNSDANALGRLVATFGQPDERWSIGEADGLCPTDTGTAARFGWLTVFVRDGDEGEFLVGYRVERPAEGPDDHPTGGLLTISGAAIGDTVADWNRTYRTSVVTTAEIDGVPVLLLLRSSDERTLLWGPLDDSDPAQLTGIYSPRPCDGGPFGST